MATASTYEPFMGNSKIQKPMITVKKICTINKKVMLIICEMMNSMGVMPTIKDRSSVPERRKKEETDKNFDSILHTTSIHSPSRLSERKAIEVIDMVAKKTMKTIRPGPTNSTMSVFSVP